MINELELKKAELEGKMQAGINKANALQKDIELMEILINSKKELTATVQNLGSLRDEYQSVCAAIEAEKAKPVEEAKEETPEA